MFHIILVLLVVVGFEGEENALVPAPSITATTEGQVAQAEATFLLGAALSTYVSRKEDGFESFLDFPEYDANHWVSGNLHYRLRPSSFTPVPVVDTLADPFDYNLILSRLTEIDRTAAQAVRASLRAPFHQSCSHAGHTPMPSAHDCGEKTHKSVLCPTLAVVHEAEDVAAAVGIIAAVDTSHRLIKQMPTRRSYRVLATHLAEGAAPANDFFMKEEERALSEASYGSLPELLTPSVTGEPFAG